MVGWGGRERASERERERERESARERVCVCEREGEREAFGKLGLCSLGSCSSLTREPTLLFLTYARENTHTHTRTHTNQTYIIYMNIRIPENTLSSLVPSKIIPPPPLLLFFSHPPIPT